MYLFEFVKNIQFGTSAEQSKYVEEYYTEDAEHFFDRNGAVQVQRMQEILEDAQIRNRIGIEKFDYDNCIYGEGEVIKNKLERLADVLEDPMSYHADIMSAIYMGVLHNMEDSNIFSINSAEDEFECVKFQEIYAIRDKINLVWFSENPHFDMDTIKKYYPIQVIEKKGSISEILGGCIKFHETMISYANIGIFDVEHPSPNYTRYSFPNMYKISESLKATPIQNLLLMEYSLGIGYANQIFKSVNNIKKFKNLEKVMPVIESGANIRPFFLRKKIMSILLDDLDVYDEEDLEFVKNILSKAIEIIDNVYEIMTELWWIRLGAYPSSELYEIRLMLENYWRQYFDVDEAYLEFARRLGILDWRGVSCAEDCFYESRLIEKAMTDSIEQEKLAQLIWGVNTLIYQGNDGKEMKIAVGKPINSVGERVFEIIHNKLAKVEMPSDRLEFYNLYKAMLQEEFLQLREAEMKLFSGKEIKMWDKEQNYIKKVEIFHIYAYVQKAIVTELLKSI